MCAAARTVAGGHSQASGRPGAHYLLKVLVAVDVLLVVGVLQLVGLDVLPERLDDDRAGLGVDAQKACQARVQLELRGLIRAQ